MFVNSQRVALFGCNWVDKDEPFIHTILQTQVLVRRERDIAGVPPAHPRRVPGDPADGHLGVAPHCLLGMLSDAGAAQGRPGSRLPAGAGARRARRQYRPHAGRN